MREIHQMLNQDAFILHLHQGGIPLLFTVVVVFYLSSTVTLPQSFVDAHCPNNADDENKFRNESIILSCHAELVSLEVSSVSYHHYHLIRGA